MQTFIITYQIFILGPRVTRFCKITFEFLLSFFEVNVHEIWFIIIFCHFIRYVFHHTWLITLLSCAKKHKTDSSLLGINTFDLGNNDAPFPHQALVIKQLNVLFVHASLGSARRHHLSVPSKTATNCCFIKKKSIVVWKVWFRFRRNNDTVRIEKRSWVCVEVNT